MNIWKIVKMIHSNKKISKIFTNLKINFTIIFYLSHLPKYFYYYPLPKDLVENPKIKISFQFFRFPWKSSSTCDANRTPKPTSSIGTRTRLRRWRISEKRKSPRMSQQKLIRTFTPLSSETVIRKKIRRIAIRKTTTMQETIAAAEKIVFR